MEGLSLNCASLEVANIMSGRVYTARCMIEPVMDRYCSASVGSSPSTVFGGMDCESQGVLVELQSCILNFVRMRCA